LSPAKIVTADAPAVAAPVKIELPPPSAILPTTAVPTSAPTPQQAIVVSVPAGIDNISIMSNEALKKRAFEIAQEIDDFWAEYDQKRTHILFGSPAANISSAEKADQVAMLELDASEKFKQRFSAEYIRLQRELITRSQSKRTPKQIDQSSLDLVDIFSMSSSIRGFAKDLQ
jgi:hypothetical protein